MKQGRNDLCFCGSGEKYKKCCYLLEQNAVPQIAQEESDDGLFDDKEFLLRAFTNLRKLSLKGKPHIKEYYKIRKMHGEIVGTMVNYYDDGKFKQTVNSDYVADAGRNNKLDLIECDFDLDTREGVQGLYDMLIYKMAPNVSCITEDFIRTHRYRKPEKIELLQSMLDARLGLFEVIEVDSGEGYVHIREVFTGKEYTLIDVGLSGDHNYGTYYLYTRIITYHGISFGTGLNLVFSKTDDFINRHIQRHKKDYRSTAEFVRFTQVYKHYSQDSDKIRTFSPVSRR